MKLKNLVLIGAAVCGFFTTINSSRAQGTAFTYQGRLNNDSGPASGSYDLSFALYSTNASGVAIAGPVTNMAVSVTNGMFTSVVDFGSGFFTGGSNWLDIAVRTNGSSLFTELTPRQQITPTPYAILAGGIVGALTVQQNSYGAPNIIEGASINYVANGAVGATIAGGGAISYGSFSYTNNVTSFFGTVSGGGGNTASYWATVGGGDQNTASGQAATASGGEYNAAGSVWTTVSGGYQNTASGEAATVSGGYQNTASGQYATVSGGANNTAKGNYAMVAGGLANYASADYSHVAGGSTNDASANYSIIGGGANNLADAIYSIVGGGVDNGAYGDYSVVAGGTNNSAGSPFASVGGGSGNAAVGQYATVPGGHANSAGGDFSFAGGNHASAPFQGDFVWADDNGGNFGAAAMNQFYVRAGGGVAFYTSSGLNAGVTLAAGSGSWSMASDRNAKENFQTVNTKTILAEVAAIPMTTWNYKTQDKSIRHVGPMAQDFHAAFQVGENDTTISTVDEGGVALAAIQGLNQKLEEQRAENADLKARLEKLEKLVGRLSKGGETK